MNKEKMIAEFNNEMANMYAERDGYSRGKIIELSKKYFARVINKNCNKHFVNGSKLDRISRMKELFEKGLVRFDGKAAKETEYLIMGVDIGSGKDESRAHLYCR